MPVVERLVGRAWAAGEALDSQGAITPLHLCLSLCTVAFNPNPPTPCPCLGPSPALILDAQHWDCKEEAASKFGSRPGLPLLFIPSVQRRMDRILNVRTAEEDVRVERAGKGKVFTEAKKQRGGQQRLMVKTAQDLERANY